MTNSKVLIELTPDQLQRLLNLLEKADSDSNQTSNNYSNQNELMRVPELSKLTGWANPTIYAMTSKNEIPFIKKGKSIFFEREKIMSWLKSNGSK